MGTRRVTGITANGNEVASLDGILIRRENQRQRISTRALKECLVLVVKALQVAVDAGVSVRMRDVDGIAKAIHVDSQPTDVAVGNGIDEFTLLVVGLDIYATMKMERAWLTEVASENDIIVHGTLIFTLNIEL
jgi:hypothetical protein